VFAKLKQLGKQEDKGEWRAAIRAGARIADPHHRHESLRRRDRRGARATWWNIAWS